MQLVIAARTVLATGRSQHGKGIPHFPTQAKVHQRLVLTGQLRLVELGQTVNAFRAVVGEDNASDPLATGTMARNAETGTDVS